MSISTKKKALLICNFPKKKMALDIDEGISGTELLKRLVSATEVEQKILELYVFYVVSYGKDVAIISLKDTENIEKLIPNNSVMYLSAPCEMLPRRKFVRRTNQEEKEEKEEKKEKIKSRFFGITLENCLTLLKIRKKRKEDIKSYQATLDFVDPIMMQLLNTTKFKKLPKSVLLDLLKRDTLIVNEFSLFEAVLSWAKTRARLILKLRYQQKKEVNKDKIKKKISIQSLSKILAPLLPYIRFPTLSTHQIIGKIHPLNILSNEQIRDLCTYASLVNEIQESNDKLKYAKVISEKNTINRFTFTPRMGLYIVLSINNGYKVFDVYEKAYDAKCKFESISGNTPVVLYSPYSKILSKSTAVKSRMKSIQNFYEKYMKGYSQGRLMRFEANYNNTKGFTQKYDIEFSISRDIVYGCAKLPSWRIPILGKINDTEITWTEDYNLCNQYNTRQKALYKCTVDFSSKKEFMGSKIHKGYAEGGYGVKGILTLRNSHPWEDIFKKKVAKKKVVRRRVRSL